MRSIPQIAYPPAWYVRPDGSLDMTEWMADWQVFWRKDGHAAEAFRYREAGPHLMLMAFLQRVINGGGRIAREYGLGRGALDLMIEWRGQPLVYGRHPASSAPCVRVVAA